jgi:DNA-binding NarL/FixJ family response regulator
MQNWLRRKFRFSVPDIVIMDINLPGMSGIECIRRIKEKCNSTQFMMFTIYEDDEKVFEA